MNFIFFHIWNIIFIWIVLVGTCWKARESAWSPDDRWVHSPDCESSESIKANSGLSMVVLTRFLQIKLILCHRIRDRFAALVIITNYGSHSGAISHIFGEEISVWNSSSFVSPKLVGNTSSLSGSWTLLGKAAWWLAGRPDEQAGIPAERYIV